jgi:bacillithiol system protein YtxJ
MILDIRRDHDLEQLLSRSKSNPVVIFKHSTQCPISAQAYEEFTEFAQARGLICGSVRVIENREISDAIEQRFGVQHESPQALLIKEGHVVWHASHWSITSDSLDNALRSHAQPADQRN